MPLLAPVIAALRLNLWRLRRMLEDPSDVVGLPTDHLTAGLVQTERHIGEARIERLALERQLAAAQHEAEEAARDARADLLAGRDDASRAALCHRHAALQKRAALQVDIAVLDKQIERLAHYRRLLRERIDKPAASPAAASGAPSVAVAETLRHAREKVEQAQARVDMASDQARKALLAEQADMPARLELELRRVRAARAIEGEYRRLRAELGLRPEGAKAARAQPI